MIKIELPEQCPSCGGGVKLENMNLYCINPDCDAKNDKIVEHFCKNMKIKGFGPSTIERLGITSITELYRLSAEDIEELLDSEKMGKKLYKELLDSLEQPAEVLLASLGIPLIGKTAAEKLASVCRSFHDLNEEVCKLANLGPKATANLMNWLESENCKRIKSIPFNFNFSSTRPSNKPTTGVVCITGKLKSFKSKAAATAKLMEHGYIVKDSVTKDVTILVNESGIESEKTKKARESGIIVITNIFELIGE